MRQRSFAVRRVREARPSAWARALGRLVTLVRTLPPLARVLARWHRERENKGKRREVDAWIRSTCTILVGLMGIAGVLLLSLLLVLKVGSLALPGIRERGGTPLLMDAEGATNLLLLGQGDGDHDGIDLTDTILVASVPQGDGKPVVLLSLPRDLYFLRTAAMGPGHLNALYRDYRNTLVRTQGIARREASLKALREIRNEVGSALGIPIHYVAKVDFTAFEALIDALEGVDVIVPSTIDDPQYPGPNYTFSPFHIDAGEQHLDGATALRYARSRSTSSDFERSGRQQQILSALAAKASDVSLLASPSRLKMMFSALADHVETDLGITELVSLAGRLLDLESPRMLSFQLSNQNGLYDEPLQPGGLLYSPPRDLFDGAAVLLPVSIPETPVTWKQIRVFAKLIFDHREVYLSRPLDSARGELRSSEAGPLTISVYNGGAREGAARKLGNEFTKFGFSVVAIANAPDGDVPISRYASRSLAAEAVTDLLMPLLGIAPAQDADAASLPSEGDLVIVVGPEYRFRPFQDLIVSP